MLQELLQEGARAVTGLGYGIRSRENECSDQVGKQAFSVTYRLSYQERCISPISINADSHLEKLLSICLFRRLTERSERE